MKDQATPGFQSARMAGSLLQAVSPSLSPCAGDISTYSCSHLGSEQVLYELVPRPALNERKVHIQCWRFRQLRGAHGVLLLFFLLVTLLGPPSLRDRGRERAQSSLRCVRSPAGRLALHMPAHNLFKTFKTGSIQHSALHWQRSACQVHECFHALS